MIVKETDVLIVGAGPCGMTAALALKRSGVTTTIVDKRETTHQYSQAAILCPVRLKSWICSESRKTGVRKPFH